MRFLLGGRALGGASRVFVARWFQPAMAQKKKPQRVKKKGKKGKKPVRAS